MPTSSSVQDLNKLRAGDIITFPLHQLKVVSTEFIRDGAFPDAVAQVVIEDGPPYDVGTHIRTPFGMVGIVGETPVGDTKEQAAA